jgi:starch synthase
MNIDLISSEVAPFSKTGGLADVAGALPTHLSQAGASVRVFTPLYRCVRSRAKEFSLRPASPPRFEMDWAGGKESPALWTSSGKGFQAYFIDLPRFYDRDGLYGTSAGDYADNGDRFAFFGRACLEAEKALGIPPDVIHGHDWQSALNLAYKKFVYGGQPFFQKTKSLFTIHNLGYQGLFSPDILDRTGLPGFLFNMEDLEFYGRVNFLKAGILYSDAVTTVSVRYSQEIQTAEFGCGLDGLLRRRSPALFGVLNGADYSAWNPEDDDLIAARYRPSDLRGKGRCRQDLLKAFGLSAKGKPILGMVSRLAGQKGLDLLVQAVEGILATGAVLAILGTGEADIEEALSAAASRHPGQLGLKLAFDNALAHKVYAGCDFFLIPSKYEPCGLTQMYSLKYGTIPIVRATGGLEDTIQEFDPASGQGNGFKFLEYSESEFVQAVRRALAIRDNKPLWKTLRRNAMACDFSWQRSAEQYLRLYERL